MSHEVRVVNLDEAFSRFDETWSPRIAAELNGQQVKLAKLSGAFVTHRHDNEDELFFVLRGRLHLELDDGTVELGPGELAVVPRGVNHRPIADEGTWVLLFEPASTLNTGNVRDERTVERPRRV